MIATKRATPVTRLLMTAAVTGALVLGGCAESGSNGGSGGGEGVDPGTSKEDYIAAFEDVDPIELRTQTPAPKGSATGKNVEDYLAAIEEWSGGKITFDIAYSNAVAQPAEIDDALNDGRLDIGQVLPIYEPSEYPATNALIETGFISNNTPVAGVLQSNAWPNEVAFNNDAILDEWDEHGLVPLVPIYNSGANGFFCREKRTGLDEISGTQAAAGGTAQSQQVEALGAAPATVAYTELFESLERGVVDCTVSSPTVAVLGGYLEKASHVVIDDTAGFALAPGGMAFSKTSWESLPLVAQQLFWDKLDVFIGGNITSKIWPNNTTAAETVAASGGEFSQFDDDAREALLAENEKILDSVRGSDALDGEALVSDAESAADKWLTIVTDELAVPEMKYADFAGGFDASSVDMDAYTSKVLDEIFAAHRPS